MNKLKPTETVIQQPIDPTSGLKLQLDELREHYRKLRAKPYKDPSDKLKLLALEVNQGEILLMIDAYTNRDQ